MKKNKILLLYPYYWPHFKAGGPVQSLFNLVSYLKGSAHFYLLSFARDTDGKKEESASIEVDKWTQGPNEENIYFVSTFTVSLIYKIVKEINPDIIYVNGIFNINTTLPGLLIGKLLKKTVIVSPRGMLQQGALALKPAKKKIFLQLFRWLGIFKNVTWHATDQQELLDIQKVFGNKSTIRLAGNIPKRPLQELPLRTKKSGHLSLIYLSLITRKKNLHIVLDALKHIETRIQFDIYGIIADDEYWRKCKASMDNSKHDIVYRGPITPDKVQAKLQDYHCFILPTKGENFGHAIYESLSVGLPIIITPYTPWVSVESYSAGMIVRSESETEWAMAIERFIRMEQNDFMNFSNNAFLLANEYFANGNFKAKYRDLFQLI